MLLSVGLLQYIATRVATLFGLLPASIATWTIDLVAVAVPVAGALTFINWRWNWRPAHIGLTRRPVDLALLALGLLCGAVAALVAHLLSGLLAGQALPVGQVGAVELASLIRLALLPFAVELVFRGAVIARYQADLSGREILVAAAITPLAWVVIQQFFGFEGPPNMVHTVTDGALSLFLTLLFVRTSSVWLSAGLRAGLLVAAALASLQIERGGLVLWGVGAAILVTMDWYRQERMPKRMPPGGGRRGEQGGRTVRGPWGPH